MRKIYFLGFFIICGLLYGYTNGNKVSFLASNYGKPSPIIPQGMVLIPQGKALIGMTDEDLTFYQGNPSVMTSFSAFYMDQTETTNAQYRKFVNWVRDSIAISSMGQSGAPALYNIPNPNAGNSRLSGPQNIDWRKIDKNSAVLWGSNSQYKSKLQNMYYSGKDALPGKNEIDVRRLKYSYSYLSLDLAAAGANDPSKKRQDFIVSYTDNPTPGSSNGGKSVRLTFRLGTNLGANQRTLYRISSGGQPTPLTQDTVTGLQFEFLQPRLLLISLTLTDRETGASDSISSAVTCLNLPD